MRDTFLIISMILLTVLFCYASDKITNTDLQQQIKKTNEYIIKDKEHLKENYLTIEEQKEFEEFKKNFGEISGSEWLLDE
jgi:hypothetical protein